MTSIRRVLAGVLSVGLLTGCSDSSDPAAPGSNNVVDGPFSVLVYSRTAGFRHTSIEVGTLAIMELGNENDFFVDATEDPTAFTADNLAGYDVVLFLNTTADVLDDTQQAVMEDFINAGGGYVGVHAAADTEYDWPFYGELVGAYFKNHPVQQTGDFDIEAPDHPSVAHLPNPWTVFDEFYSFRTNPRGDVRVLMAIDESTYFPDPNTSNLPDSPTFPAGETGVMGDHPMSWCHDKFAGRAWYTALGHEAYLYQQPAFREHLLNGILTAARRVAADCGT